MPRVEIELPATFTFRTEVPIRIGDINYGNHLGNDAVLSIVQEARLQFFRSHGWTELDVGGPGIILVDAAVMYRAEGKYGMVLVVELAAADVRTRGCDLLYRITDRDTGQEIARAKTGLVFFDYTTKKVVHMPEAFRAAIGATSA